MKPGRPKKKPADRRSKQLLVRLDPATMAALRKAGKPSTLAREAVEAKYKPQ